MSVDLQRIRYQEEVIIPIFDDPIELNIGDTQLFHYDPSMKFRCNLESQTASSPSYWDNYFKSYPDLDEGHPETYMSKIAIVVLAGLGYALPDYVDFRCAKSIQILALGILTAAGFGIMRNLRIGYQCIEYFTIGHSRLHKRSLKTNNFIANGLVRGLDPVYIGILVGVGLVLAARATKYNPISVHQITPYAAALAAISSFITYLITKKTKNFIELTPAPPDRTNLFKGVMYPSSREFHPVDLRKIPADKHAIWFACQLSNYVGFYSFYGGSILLMVGVVVARFFKR